MNKRKKFMSLFLWSVIFSVMFVSSGFSEDVAKHATGHVKPPIDFSHVGRSTPEEEEFFKNKASSFSASYDLRKLNRVSKTVGNQDPYGTCWAFADLGAMESNYMTQGLTSLGSNPNLSELHLAWFAYKDPTKGHYFPIDKKMAILNQNGHILKTVALLSRMSGPVVEKSMPYSQAGTNVKESDSVMTKYVGDKKPSDYFPLALKLHDWIFLGSVSDDNREKQKENIKKMLSVYGAVSVSFYAVGNFDTLQGKKSAYFDNSKEEGAHNVLIIGWNDNYSRKNFSPNKPKANGAWICKNSYGKDWGNGGYFYMSYEQFIADASVFIVEEAKTDEKVYYHDPLGFVSSHGYGTNTPAYAANVFKATATEGISSVGVYATDDNTKYEIYICNDLGTKKPSLPLSRDVKTVARGTFVNAGYHTVDLVQHLLVKKNRYFSVIIKMTTQNSDKPIAVERVVKGYSNGAVIKSKESYFSPDMLTWTDGTKIRNDENKVVKSNACIKVFTFSVIPIDEKHFPDEKFRSWVIKNCDFDKDGYLSTKEISQIKNVNVGKCNIANLKGIEYFTAMKILSCSNNEMTKLDVSKCNALETLTCNNNKLTSLTLSKNTSLKYLECAHNQLTKINISKCASLESLSCSYNQLTTLTLSNNISLKRLDCEYNQLIKLNVSKCNALEELYCYNNQLKTLTLGDNILLEKIFCNNNQLTKLDISKCTALKSLQCNDNQLKILTIGDNIALESLHCPNNQLTNLNVSKCNALEWLYCNDNQLKNLTLGNNTALEYFQCYNNQLTKLNVSKCTSLKILGCYNNQIKTLTLGVNTALEELYCHNNQLTALNVSKCSALVKLDCYENKIKTLTFGSNTALKYIRCYSNQITNLNVSKCTALNTLYCHNNKLKTITFGQNIALEYFSCDDNQLTTLDVSKCTSLISLSCSNNQLTTLKLGNNTAYSMFVYCINNKLTEIDASGCFNVHIVADDGVEIIWPSSGSAASYSSQNIDAQNHGGYGSNAFKTASLKISDDDILWQGTERDEDLVKVKANMPVTFIIGEWLKSDGTKANVLPENIQIFVDDNVVEGIEISQEKIFTLPAEFVRDDFKASVKAKFAGNELESDELFISAEE